MSDDEDTLDSRGIPGWDRVGKLARALIGIEGLGIAKSQVLKIQKLYEELHTYDKRPLVFKPMHHGVPRGRFARSKSGHIGLDHMKR